MFGLGFVGSLVGAIVVARVMSKGRKKIQLYILVLLNLVVALGVIPNAMFDLKYYGWAYLN